MSYQPSPPADISGSKWLVGEVRCDGGNNCEVILHLLDYTLASPKSNSDVVSFRRGVTARGVLSARVELIAKMESFLMASRPPRGHLPDTFTS